MSKELTDDTLDEFLEALGDGPSTEKESNHRRIIKAPDEEGDDAPRKPGEIVQYSTYSTGYLPTSRTVQTLPAGSYHIRYSPQVGVYMDPMKIVTDTLIEFPDTQSDAVIAEIDLFWTLKAKFTEFGFTHKRGFLLWGPPGSGKSCTIAMIVAKMVKKGGIVIIAENPGLLSSALTAIRSAEPDRQIVVIWEDIDAVIHQFGEPEVLAILDGESQIDNVVFIASTNYPENLDARITNRPSRFDRIEKIGMPSAAARKLYLLAKAKSTVSPDGVDLVAESDGFSIAHLRELIVGIWCLGSPTNAVLRRLKAMKTKKTSGGGEQKVGFQTEEASPVDYPTGQTKAPAGF